MGGEPYTWRRVRTVRGQAVGNLSPKGDKAPTAEPTSNRPESGRGYETAQEKNRIPIKKDYFVRR